jgi:uncharacterized membrane-anchored protein YitT (DUF2179 family)
MKKFSGFIMMTLGCIFLAAGVYFFKIPNGFATGGVTGIATILGKITPITPSIWILGLNILLLILGFIFFGKKTGLKTVYCSLAYSALTFVFESLVPLDKPVTAQPFMELAYAMLLTSIGSAIIFYCDASSGGTDIVALILKKYLKIDVGKALLGADCIVAIGAFFVFDIETGLFSLLGLFAKAFIVDAVIENLNSCKYFIVITSKHEEISKYIMEFLHHGVTVSKAVGEYTQEEKAMLHTVCRRIEAIRLREQIRKLDPEAFIIITTSSEIIGRGFRSV